MATARILASTSLGVLSTATILLVTHESERTSPPPTPPLTPPLTPPFNPPLSPPSPPSNVRFSFAPSSLLLRHLLPLASSSFSSSSSSISHCLGYRPSNNIPTTNRPIDPATLQRTTSQQRKDDANLTIDDIESFGFEIQGLLGEGSFGHVYAARVVGWESGMTEPGDRVAIKRMSKRGVLRPVDQDDYHAEDGSGSESGSERESGSGGDRKRTTTVMRGENMKRRGLLSVCLLFVVGWCLC